MYLVHCSSLTRCLSPALMQPPGTSLGLVWLAIFGLWGAPRLETGRQVLVGWWKADQPGPVLVLQPEETTKPAHPGGGSPEPDPEPVGGVEPPANLTDVCGTVTGEDWSCSPWPCLLCCLGCLLAGYGAGAGCSKAEAEAPIRGRRRRTSAAAPARWGDTGGVSE